MRALRVGSAGNHSPGLADRIDLTFLIFRGTQWLSVIVISTAIPVPIPGIGFKCNAQVLSLLTIRSGLVFCGRKQIADTREIHEHGMQEPSQPDAFSPSLNADVVHSVIPITSTDQWQSVGPACRALSEGAAAMFIERPHGTSRELSVAFMF